MPANNIWADLCVIFSKHTTHQTQAMNSAASTSSAAELYTALIQKWSSVFRHTSLGSVDPGQTTPDMSDQGLHYQIQSLVWGVLMFVAARGGY